MSPDDTRTSFPGDSGPSARSPAGLPRIVIVGRPNVGKSTLTNRLVGSRVSIVEPTAGVTRDRVTIRARLRSGGQRREVEVVDTGGIGIVDRDDLGPLVEEQVRIALATADLVLFVVDARDGVTPLDREVADRLRGETRPILLLCNKVEGGQTGWAVEDFRSLGMESDPIPISAQNGNGITDLLELIMERLPIQDPDAKIGPAPSMKLAIIGRRNAGKSTLINSLAREERVIVSEVPGTTRDAVDVVIERDGETFILIDTAGVRKKSSMADAVEFFSDARSHKAIRRADLILLLFDATRPLSVIEKKLARYVRDRYKPVVIGANKWDLVDGVEPEEFRTYLDRTMPGLGWAPISFMSAKTGLNVSRTLELVREIRSQANMRFGTGELNRVLKRAMEGRTPESGGHRLRIYYATQTDGAPPTFLLFVNERELFGKNTVRYLENRLREGLGIEDVPIRIMLRNRSKVDPDAPA